MHTAPHDIVKIKRDASISWPSWCPETDLFATVRRGQVVSGQVALGLRGASRSQRFAFSLPEEAILSVTHPNELVDRTILEPKKQCYQVVQLYAQAQKILVDHDWGVGGSLGFELATGIDTIHPKSDLDLVLYCEQKADLPLDLVKRYPTFFDQVDLQVITKKGGFLLKEYLQYPDKKILLKTLAGPVLTYDLW